MNPLYYYYSLVIIALFGVIWIVGYRFWRDKLDHSLKLRLALQKSSDSFKEHSEKKEEEKRNEEYKKIIQHTQEKDKKNDSTAESLSSREVSRLLKQAEVHLGNKDYADSEKILIQILSYDEHQKHALEVLSELYLEQKSYQKSAFFLEKYFEKHKPTAIIYNNYALAQLHLKNFSESIKYYSKAIELENHNDIRYTNLGHVFIALENYDDAIKCFQEALKIAPRNLEYHRYIAQCFRKQNAFPESKKWIERLLDLAPYDTDAQKELERLEALGY